MPAARPPKPPPAISAPAWRASSVNASPSCVTRPPSSAMKCSPRCAPAKTGTDGVHQKTLKPAREVHRRLQSLNFAGDVEMERQLDRVRSELLTRSAEDYRNNLTATRSLRPGSPSSVTKPANWPGRTPANSSSASVRWPVGSCRWRGEMS